jgi:hypothetical protein
LLNVNTGNDGWISAFDIIFDVDDDKKKKKKFDRKSQVITIKEFNMLSITKSLSATTKQIP